MRHKLFCPGLVSGQLLFFRNAFELLLSEGFHPKDCTSGPTVFPLYFVVLQFQMIEMLLNRSRSFKNR